jgi:HTH-type transcriptional regulator, glycine betaine synthesis regulator
MHSSRKSPIRSTERTPLLHHRRHASLPGGDISQYSVQCVQFVLNCELFGSSLILMSFVARAVRPDPRTSLAPAEREVIEFFVNLGRYVSLPRSVGEIYGILFARGEKLTLDDLVTRLGMSKGSASQGLRMLRGVGAVRISHLPGDRKDYYEAEAELPHLLRGFLRDQLASKLDHADRRLDRLRAVIDDPSSGAPAGLSGRVELLRSWQNKIRRIVPLVSTFLKI